MLLLSPKHLSGPPPSLCSLSTSLQGAAVCLSCHLPRWPLVRLLPAPFSLFSTQSQSHIFKARVLSSLSSLTICSSLGKPRRASLGPAALTSRGLLSALLLDDQAGKEVRGIKSEESSAPPPAPWFCHLPDQSSRPLGTVTSRQWDPWKVLTPSSTALRHRHGGSERVLCAQSGTASRAEARLSPGAPTASPALHRPNHCVSSEGPTVPWAPTRADAPLLFLLSRSPRRRGPEKSQGNLNQA